MKGLGKEGVQSGELTSSRISLVETLVWRPAPFQSPAMGFGCTETLTPKSSAMRCSKKRAIHSWSPTDGVSDFPLGSQRGHLTYSLCRRMVQPGTPTGPLVGGQYLCPMTRVGQFTYA